MSTLPAWPHHEHRDPRWPNRCRRRLRSFNQKWGDVVQLALGSVLAVVSLVVVLIALQIRDSSTESAASTRQQCVRARTFGPPLARAFEKHHFLTPALLAKYRETIPDRCPGS